VEPLSLETPVGDEEDPISAIYRGQERILPIDAAIHLRETTTRKLASLTPREERVLHALARHEHRPHPRKSVSSSCDRERIRQIEAKALRKLKHPSRSRKLRSFLTTDHPVT
jgi:RNA polymerase primary sigma factor